jgi:hypothetical protein
MANAEKTTGFIPQNSIASTGALKNIDSVNSCKSHVSANKANEVNAAEAIAKLFLLLP